MFVSVDKILSLVVITILAFGIWISITATPAIAIKLGFSPFYFVKHHIVFIPISLCLIFGIPLLNSTYIRVGTVLGYCIFLVLIVSTLFFGTEIKGARRWLNIFGFSLQPSEFFKPILSVITGWFISKQYENKKFPGVLFSFISVIVVEGLLLMQPDVGMAFIIFTTWFAQLFIAGISIVVVIAVIFTSIFGLVSLYFIYPHFADRVNRFLFPTGENVDLYQITKSIEAFQHGGIFGKGPGEGTIKMLIPDAHSDFVFSVIGEEFGLFACLVIIGLFVILLTRSFLKITKAKNTFCTITIFGIIFQISIQVLVNISSALNIIPTKGMTLPLISYGGSSLLASSVSIGILLALTKYEELNSK